MRTVVLSTVAIVGFAAAAWAENASPTDLDWLRGEVGDGALVHHADGRIYLTELMNPETVHVGNGNQPEFSPDGSKLAWIDGRAAKGRMRKGDGTVHVLAENVEGRGGVHWLSNDEVAVVLRDEKGLEWYRVSLAGDRAEIPELTALGTGGYEADIRQGPTACGPISPTRRGLPPTASAGGSRAHVRSAFRSTGCRSPR